MNDSQTLNDALVNIDNNRSNMTLHPEVGAVLSTDSSFNTQKNVALDTSAGQKIISACIGSLVTSVVVTPFDVIKTRLQFQSIRENSFRQKVPIPQLACLGEHYLCQSAAYRSILYSEWPIDYNRIVSSFSLNEPSLRFNGTIDAFSKIVKHEGIAKLWRGLSPTLLQSFPSTIIYYVGYDALRDYLSIGLSDSPSLSFYSPLFAGGLARSLSATVISPIELFRTRLQSSGKSKTSTDVANDILSMVRKQGISSLWRGLTPTLWRDIPFSAIYWMGYETTKSKLSMDYEGRLSPFGLSFASGAFSGIFAAFVTTPFDVIKTRHQINSSNTLLSPRSSGTFNVFLTILRQEGWRELFQGLTARVAKVAPACAIMVSSYEFGKAYFAARDSSETSNH